ncbi:MAG: hypothetical protein R3C59_13890 [Planctomycetaceae bacterium]
MIAIIWLGLLVGVILVWHSQRRREAAWERLNFSNAHSQRPGSVSIERSGRRLRRHWMWVPWALTLLVGLTMAFGFQFRAVYAVSAALMVGLLAARWKPSLPLDTPRSWNGNSPMPSTS